MYWSGKYLPNLAAVMVGNIYPFKTTKRIYKVKQKFVHLFNITS